MDFKRITGLVTGAILAVLGLCSPALAGDATPGPTGPGKIGVIDILRQLAVDLRIAETPRAGAYTGAFTGATIGTATGHRTGQLPSHFPGKTASPVDDWTAFRTAGQAVDDHAIDWNRDPGTADVPEIDLATVMAFLRSLDPVQDGALAHDTAAIRAELAKLPPPTHGGQTGAAIVNAVLAGPPDMQALGADGWYDVDASHGPGQVLTARFLTDIGAGSIGGMDGGSNGGGDSYARRGVVMAALYNGFGADAGTEDATGLTGWIHAGGSNGGTVSDMAAWSLRPAIHGAGADSSGGWMKVDLAGAAGIGGKDWVVRNQPGTGLR